MTQKGFEGFRREFFETLPLEEVDDGAIFLTSAVGHKADVFEIMSSAALHEPEFELVQFMNAGRMRSCLRVGWLFRPRYTQAMAGLSIGFMRNAHRAPCCQSKIYFVLKYNRYYRSQYFYAEILQIFELKCALGASASQKHVQAFH